MVQPRSSYSTPPLHVHPNYGHPGNAGYLSPRTLAGTLDSWNDAIPSGRRSPSPISPSTMGSFVNKAKAMLRGKRNSVQATPSDFASGKLDTRRITSHYQTLSTRPPPQRQATAPLPSRRLTKSKPPRPALKQNDGSYAISSPITSNTEATYKYCELIDTADMAARASQFLGPREHLARSPSPSRHSDVGPEGLPTRRFASSESVNRRSTAQDTDFQDTATVYGFRPRSDLFPLSVAASSSGSRVETIGLKDRVLATFNGYESHESLTECHAPFEYDSLTLPELRDSATIQEPGLRVSETIRAISNAGMLDGSGSWSLNEPVADPGQKLENVFATDEGNYEGEAGYPLTPAWLGTDVGGRSSILGATPDTSRRTARGSSRPVWMARCLELMAAGGPEALLTPWRAQLDPTCRFTLQSVNERRDVDIVTNNGPASAQSAIVDTRFPRFRPAPIEPSRTTKPLVPRSRSKTMLSVPSSASPPVSMRRSKTGHARRVVSPSQSISSSLWEPASAPPTTNLFTILDPHAIASSSRTLNVETINASAATQGNTMPKRHRDTRETFPGSQMAHVVKGSRGAGVGGGIRSRYRVPTPYKSLEPARSLKQINTKGFDENSAEWIAVSSTPAPSHIPKSPAQRALYVSPPKGSYSSSRRAQTGDGMSKSPPMRGGMVKSPSVRSGLSKSGMRRGLSASQSRSSLHASPPQSRSGVRTRAYGSPSRRARFPASSSTRSLPGGRHEAVGTGTASPRSRLPRSAGRPSKSERRPPGYRGSAGKENVPANKGKEDTSGPESPLRIRVANALHFGLGSPGPLIDGHQTAYSHTPNTSAPVSPRRRKQDERDMMCTHAKVLAAEIMNGSAMLGAPTVSARSPTRPRTHNRI